MPFFNHQTHIRVNDDIVEKINLLLDAFPDRFRTQSQVVRAAVLYMYRKEVLDKHGED